MKDKLQKSLLYIYIIPIILITGLIIAFILTIFFTTTTTNNSGKIISTNWARKYAQNFISYIDYQNNDIKISQNGLNSLKENNCWIQIINEYGDEVTSVDKPDNIASHYTPFDLLLLYQNGSSKNTVIVGNVENSNYVYLIGCPVQVSKSISYVDKERYNSGKTLIIASLIITVLLAIGLGIWYCIFISKHLNKIYLSLKQISKRTYHPINSGKFLHEIYDGLNGLDQDICSAEQIRKKNELARSEWIENITHDLKTPLVPIKGYAELLSNQDKVITSDKAYEYGNVITKNTLYVEQLIKDLNLTYQLQNGMLPVNNKRHDFVRFIKELVIDILNTPEYSKRKVSFESDSENIILNFDTHLLKRAINNIIINSLIHNSESTEVLVKISYTDTVNLLIKDTGKGMNNEELSHLFNRYYRGTNTDAKPEGTGLGMAIAKQIIEFEQGSITAHSTISQGTSFFIQFSKSA